MKLKKKWLVTALAAVACAIALAGCKAVSDPAPVAVENITLDTTKFTLEQPGDARQLTATVTPYNADDRTVTWSSSDADVATAYGGFVIAQGVGTATITAQAGGKIATCVVTVPSRTVENIMLDATTLVLEPGNRRMLIATIMPATASDRNVTWSSSNPGVATVDDDGIITAHNEGTATIYAQAGGRMATCEVTVSAQAIAVESITLSTNELTIEKGETRTLIATVTPCSAVTWSSSNTDVATVDDDGIITAHNEGTATITARAGDMEATCTVTVKKILIPVESITLDKDEITLTRGETCKLTATVTPDDADDRTVAWWSSNTEVATVDNDGTITALKSGYTCITAQAGNRMAECEVYVVVPVESVTLDVTTLSIKPGTTRKLTATVTPDDADDTTVEWSSSNTYVATVNEYGSVDARAEGTAIITAQAGDKTATCTVTVKTTLVAVERVELNKNTLTLMRGNTEKLTATVTPSNADNTSVAWSSSDTSIARVDSDGTVTAVKAGSATITAKADNMTAECSVTVNPIPVENITLNKNTLTLTRDKTEKLTATVTPSNAENRTVTWSSSDTSVATVGNDGTVKAGKAGKAIITAKAGGRTATCEVNVKAIPVESVTLDATTLMLAPNMSKKLTATVTPSDADDRTVAWSSSDTSIATVDSDGTVKAVKAGSATITANAGGKTATCKITVHTDHTYSGGKCTVCGVKPYLEGGTIDDNGVLTKYNGNAATVVIPDGVTGIGNYVFYGRTSITSVTIPDSVTNIGDYAFEDCTNLKTVIYDGTLADWCGITWTTSKSTPLSNKNSILYINNKMVTDAVIPNNVTKIKPYAFYGCTSLESVTIPASVTSIGSNAFSRCTSLTNVTIPDSVTSIGEWVFSSCTNLKSVTIADSVRSIGNFMFDGCTSLVSVTIPASVTRLGDQMFRGCTSLTSVTIPDGVTSIGISAFSSTNLKSITIPGNVTTLGQDAFSECMNLTSVTIPASMTKIGQNAFNECTKLISVTYKGTEEQWNDIIIFASGLSGKTIKGSDGKTWTAK